MARVEILIRGYWGRVRGAGDCGLALGPGAAALFGSVRRHHLSRWAGQGESRGPPGEREFLERRQDRVAQPADLGGLPCTLRVHRGLSDPEWVVGRALSHARVWVRQDRGRQSPARRLHWSARLGAADRPPLRLPPPTE